MISREHKKHADLAKPSSGNFGRNEFAIAGTTCANVKILAGILIKSLSSQSKIGYIDATHANEGAVVETQEAFISYTDNISSRDIRFKNELTQFPYRQLFNEADLLLINGNHFEGAKQILVIDKAKETSLLKHVAKLNNVVLILLHDNADGIPDFIKEAVPYWQQLPLLKYLEENNIIDFFKQQLIKATPVLNGLVLAGGKSTRMGFDKSMIEWHGKKQHVYMAETLLQNCKEVFISCRPEQQESIQNYKTIADSFTGLGPYGALLSAFRENPDAAWLVTACDLPLLDQETLTYLVQHRDTSKIATAYESPHDGFPEPLIAIWEPKAYPILLSFLGQGFSCPRKVLRNNDVKLIKALHPEKLMNVNTEAELIEARVLLGNKTATA